MRLWVKLAWVLAMTLAILVPLSMVREVIADRQAHRQHAVSEVAASFAGAQAFTGPVLVVPYTETVDVEEPDGAGAVRTVTRQREGRWTFFPATLDVAGTLVPDTRRLGLHAVRVYEWKADAKARFDVRIPADGDPARPRTIGKPWLGYGIADVRGLLGSPVLQVDGRSVVVAEGQGGAEAAGVHARLAAPRAGDSLMFDTRLRFALGGTESLAIVPLARSNTFAIRSAWPHPRFGGSFLPRARDVDAHGFSARWQVASVASNAQRQYLDGARFPALAAATNDQAAAKPALDAVGIALVDPVDSYTLADRATKYGLLFVLLTFLGFFILELVRQLPVHPIQYGLVGLAIAIFFLLLVSLGEHIRFGVAYVVASAACIGLIVFYLSAVLRSFARGLGFGAMLATLYAALYGLLVSEDNALVLGSGLLFVILAALMAITRHVDWYQLAGRGPRERA